MPTEPIPSILYHYTTQQGFLGIFKEKALWASSIRHLNDSTEFNYAFDIASRLLGNGEKFRESVTQAKELLLTLRQALGLYIVSFSSHPDQLSQWRAYCREGSGFNIGFDSQGLETLAKRRGGTLQKCTYDETAHEAMIKK